MYWRKNPETGKHEYVPSQRKKKREEKFNEILREMCENQKPGETFTLKEIGEAIGVSKEAIRIIERSALRKLRKNLAMDLGLEDVDIVQILKMLDDQKSIDILPA